MKFLELDVVSFGKWSHKKIPISDELSYFYGPNEAGKSSIRMFIIYILFGLKSDEREQYISKVDGQLGGRLLIEVNYVTYTLERFSHKNRGHLVVTKDGIKLSDKEVNKVLKGINRPLFESIFSFEDRDLQSIRQHKKEDIGTVLFNLGLTGSDQITQLEKELIKESDELFKKQGKRPPLNEKLTELQKIQQEIHETERKEREHQHLYKHLEDIDQTIESLKVQEHEIVAELNYYEKLNQVKSPVVKHQILTDEMKQFKDAESFPEDGQNQLNHLAEQIKAQGDQLNQITDSVQRVKKDIDNLTEASQVDKWPVAITEAQHIVQKVEQFHTDIERSEEQLKQLKYDYKKIEEELGFQIDLNSIKSVDIHHYTNENWKRLSAKWDQLKSQIQSNKLKLHHKYEELNDLERQRNEIDKWKMSSSDLQSIQERYDQIKLDEQKQQLEKQYQQQIEYQRTTINKVKGFVATTKWLLPFMILLLTSMLLIRVNVELLTIYGGLAVGLILAITIFYTLNKIDQHIKRTLKRLKSTGSRSSSYEEEMSELKRQLNDQEELEKQLNQIQHYIQSTISSIDELKKEQEYVQQSQIELEQEIEEHINKYPFLKRFDLFHWPSVYDWLKKGKQTALAQTDIEENITKTKSEMERELSILHTIIQLYEKDRILTEPRLVCDLALNYIDKEKSWLQNLEQKREWLKEQKNEKSRLTESTKQLQVDLNNLLSKVNAKSTDDFLEKAREYKQLKNKTQQRNDLYEMVYEVFNSETDYILQKNINWLEVESQFNDHKQTIERNRAEIDNQQKLKAQIQAEINHLESSGVLSDLVHQKAMIESEVVKLAKEWAVKKVAFSTLKETKNRYQNVYLPDIMEKTSEYFYAITDERYDTIQFNKDESIMVKSTSGLWFDVSQLSEGTADQLYIALRFALNDSLSTYVHLPFILDDAFVHFDQSRKEQVLKLILKKSNDQQIIYLTCEDQDSQILNIKPSPLQVG